MEIQYADEQDCLCSTARATLEASGMGKLCDNTMMLEVYEVEFLENDPEISLQFTPQARQFYEQHKNCELSSAYSQLRSLGFYPRNGLKFGCDFLLYTTKDPAEAHSVCMCHLSYNGTVSVPQLMLLNRIAGTVNKTMMVGYLNENRMWVFKEIM